jgi:hypothetical protein
MDAERENEQFNCCHKLSKKNVKNNFMLITITVVLPIALGSRERSYAY